MGDGAVVTPTNPVVVAPEDGTIASIDVTVGASVESGDTLATLN